MNPTETISRMNSTGLVASCQPGNESSTISIINASYKGGLRVFEMKHHREDRSFYLFRKAKAETKNLTHLALGAGAVPNAFAAEVYLQAGAHFILSPFLRKDMASACQDHDKLWIPGCTSLNDIESAVSMGAKVVNILPAQLLGINFFNEVQQNFPGLELIPSGGITVKEIDLQKWYAADILCIRMPHELFNKEAVQLKDWSGIELQVFSLMQRIKKVRSSINTFVMKGDDGLAQKN